MKTPILLLALTAIALGSCTTAYKTGQTPDDVYYSPARPQDETVREEKNDNKDYRYEEEYYDDRYLRMKVHSRYRWSYLDDWYLTDRYSIGYNYYFGSFNNPYNRWNYYYNPYCCCLHNYNYVFVNPKIPTAAPVVRKNFNLGYYTNTSYSNSNNNRGMFKTSTTRTGNTTIYNNTNNNSSSRNNDGLSNKVRTIFSGDNSGSRTSRTYTPSSSSSSGSSSSGGSRSSGGSSGSVSRPGRN